MSWSRLHFARCWVAGAVLCLATWSVPACAGNSRARDVAAVERDAAPAAKNPTYRGMATFYGPGFAGEMTASGEIFNPRKMVAAHRTLPLGSVVRVTNLANGRAVVLRVIDRGPYSGRNTIIDVSQGAARKLGFIRQGRTRVKVEVLEVGRR